MQRVWIGLSVLLLVPLMAACGGGNSPANTPTGVALAETFTSSEGGIELTFQYPEGWVTQGTGGQVMLANSQPVLDVVSSDTMESVDLPDGGYGMQIQLLPAADMPPDTTPDQLLAMLAEGGQEEGVTVGEVQTVQVNGQNGAKASVTFPNDSGEIYLYPSGEYFVLVFAAASSYDTFQATTQAVVNSIRVQ